MPQFPKPFFRPARRLWYVQLDGKQINLGSSRQEAFDQYHKIMGGRLHGSCDENVVAILETFLEWAHQNTAVGTYDWYQRHLQAFAGWIGCDLRISQLTPNHFTQLFAKRPNWSNSTRNGVCRAVQRAVNWATEQRLIDRSPIAKMRKPKCKTREVIITSEEFDEYLTLIKGEHFKELLVAAWETGARPQELTCLEARHVDLANGRWLFPVNESKGKKMPRIVYLSEEALLITRKLMLRHPQGSLFRNEEGNPGTRNHLRVPSAVYRLPLACGG
jgi:integrase